MIGDIPVRLRVRRKRQDPRTEKLLQSIATILINSRCLSAASVQKSSKSCLKNVAQFPHHDGHPRHCSVCSVHVLIQFATIAPRKPLVQGVFNVDDENSCSNAPSSLVESDCVSAEGISSRRSRICGDESRRGRCFSWMHDAKVPCCCHLNK